MAHTLARLLDRKLRSSEWRQLLLLCIIVSLAFWPLLVGRFYAVGDMRDVFIPLENFFSEYERQGIIPAWHHEVSWGFPVIAAAQIGFFYPPLVAARLLPLPLYMSLILYLHVLALGAGMYVWLRKLRQSTWAALFGSVSFTLSGFFVQHVSHFNITLAIAWLPWQLLVAQWVGRQTTYRWYHVASLASVLGIPFLIGQIQVPLLCALVVCAYLMQHAHHYRKKITASLLVLALSGVLAIGTASAQLLPTLELARYSSRGVGSDFDLTRANQHSYPLYHLPTLLFPRFFGNDSTYWGKRLEIEYGFYVGVIPLLLAAWAVRTRWRHHVFWIGIASATFFLALGELSPFRLLGIEPSLWYFSAPARWLLLTTLALSVLAGYGFDYALEQRQRVATFFQKIAWGIAGLVVIGNAALLFRNSLLTWLYKAASTLSPSLVSGRPPAYYDAKITQLAESFAATGISLRSFYTLLALGALLLLPLLLKRGNRRLLVALAGFELIVLTATLMPTLSWAEILQPPSAIIEQLPVSVKAMQARVYALKSEGDTGVFLTNPASRPTLAGRALEKNLLVPLTHAQFDIPGVVWPASLDFTAQSVATGTLYENGTFATAQANSLNIGALLAPRTLPLEVPNSTVISDDLIAIYGLDPVPRAGLRISPEQEIPQMYTTPRPGKISIETESEVPGELIIRDTWYPGWTASINGTTVPIQKHGSFFMAVPVPAGKNAIEFTFRSPALRWGLIISLGTAAVVAATLLLRLSATMTRARSHATVPI